MIKTHKKILLALFLFTLIIINSILLMPEVLRERIFPYDAALFAANGAFFLSIFHDFANFISAPMDWVWGYYHQYPALFISRHPPILGLVESVMFGVFGISAVTAKVTIFLFSILGIVGWFFAFLKMFKDEWIAFWATLLMLTFPQSVSLGTSVRADVPAMAFFAWGCYWFACYLETSKKKFRYAMLAPLLILCCFYTYQLTMFGVVALFFYALTQWRSLYKRSDFYLGIILFMLLMLPLVVFNLKIIGRTAVGGVSKSIQDFAPFASRWTLANWTYYLKLLFERFPLPIIGLILWGLTRIRVAMKKYELFFLMWFLLGYVGFSLIPSKNVRYIYFFILAAFPLTVIGIRDSVKLFTQQFFSEKIILGLTTVVIFALVALNITGIAGAKTKYVQDLDKTVQAILLEDKSARILYHGAFESAFIFYTRKYDSGRQARVFRTANELNDPENLLDDISEHNITFVAIESEDLRKNTYEGSYTTFYHKLNELIMEKKENFQHFGDFKTLYGQPDNQNVVYIKVYKVI